MTIITVAMPPHLLLTLAAAFESGDVIDLDVFDDGELAAVRVVGADKLQSDGTLSPLATTVNIELVTAGAE